MIFLIMNEITSGDFNIFPFKSFFSLSFYEHICLPPHGSHCFNLSLSISLSLYIYIFEMQSIYIIHPSYGILLYACIERRNRLKIRN
jgi:hypothetical protein